MNKKAVLIFIHGFLFICFANPVLIAQQNGADFLPLKIGNLWVYEYFSPTPPPNGIRYRFKSIVSKDTLINSRKYFFISSTKYISYFDTLNWFRVDSTNGNFFAFKPGILCRPGNEILIDSLASGLNDRANDCTIPQYRRMCYYSNIIILFSLQVQGKVFNYEWIVNSDYKTYAKNFGIARCYTPEPPAYTITLLGCIINGIMYGDTSLIGIRPILNEIPEKFNLYQNYPNPFNPETKIRIDIPINVKSETSNVKLIIFDLLGREVATLVNEQLKPGTYEVEWPACQSLGAGRDGSGYASGIYFYSLVTEEFTQTKKLILLK